MGMRSMQQTSIRCLPTLAGAEAWCTVPASSLQAAPAALGRDEADRKWCQLLAVTSGGCTLHGDGHALQRTKRQQSQFGHVAR